MEQEIKWVSETFGEEPSVFVVGQTYGMHKLAKIVIEQVYDTGDPYDFYVGYSEGGRRMFQFRLHCTNVGYK